MKIWAMRVRTIGERSVWMTMYDYDTLEEYEEAKEYEEISGWYELDTEEK